jgi:hypothetical protein
MNQQRINQQSMNQTSKQSNNTTKPLYTYRNTSQSVLQTVSSGYSGSKVIGIIIVVVVVILLVGASYWLYNFYSNRVFQTTVETEVMPDVKDAGAKFSAVSGSIPSSKYSNEYSISMWLNIDNYTYKYGQEKIVLRRGDAGAGNPEIVLDAKNNDLIVRLKLQNAPAANPLMIGGSTASVSKFEDVSKLALQTHQYGNNELIDNAYKNGGILSSGESRASNVLDRVGSNLVDYPTIQYQISCGCNNALTTMKPDNAMTLMIEEQAARMKEGFKNNSGTGMLDDGLARVDTERLSDNSAPIELQHVYHNDYFAAISGNNVPSSKLNTTIRENFDVTNDLINACTAVILDLCNLANILQSPTSADNQVSNMNTTFQSIIDALERSRTTAKTGDEINAIFDTSMSMSNIYTIMSPSSSIEPVIDKLTVDLTNLETVSNQSEANTISMATIQNGINSKLASNNCPLTLTGTNDVNITTNFYQAFISLVKKSLYTYINNLSHGIQKVYPELASSQSASCLIQNATDSDPTVGTCIYRGIPLQRWIHVVVSVYNQVIDIFIDGQLASSCVLKAFPAISTSDVQITPDGGFAGKISRVTFSNTAMTVTHAKQLYYAGPVPSSSLWSMIPNWVWYGIIIIIVVGIAYSLFV